MGKKIAIFAAFKAGNELLKFIRYTSIPIDVIFTCNTDNSIYEPLIADSIKTIVYRRININEEQIANILNKLQIDIAFLIWWPTIVNKNILNSVKEGFINLHPSLLPYGKGKHGYYWSIVDNEPFGVSLHLVDKSIDGGPIIFQKTLQTTWEDTGETLYSKSWNACLDLFKESFIKIINGDYKVLEKNKDGSSFHMSSDIEIHSQIDLDKKYIARDLINIIRARTFHDGNSSYFIENGKKYLIRSEIKEC